MQNGNTIYCNSPGRVGEKLAPSCCNALNYNVLQVSPPLNVDIKYKIQCAIVQHPNVPCGSALFLDER